MGRGFVIFLTQEQQILVKPFMNKLADENLKDKPGIVLGQIYSDHMDIGFVSHKKACAIQKIMGGKVGKLITSAFEKEE